MIILLTHSDNVWSDKPLLLSSLVIMFPPFLFFFDLVDWTNMLSALVFTGSGLDDTSQTLLTKFDPRL